MSLSLRPIWSTELVSGQPSLHKSCLEKLKKRNLFLRNLQDGLASYRQVPPGLTVLILGTHAMLHVCTCTHVKR